MVKKIYYVTCLVMISFVTVFAQTNPITIKTDDNNYDEGDTIVISGQVTTIVPDTPIVVQIFHEGNMVDIAQITVAQDGSYTHTVIAEGPLWNKAGDYTIRASFGEGNVAETEFGFTPKTDVLVTTDIFEVDAGNSGTFDVEFTIKGGTVKNMVADPRNFALRIQIEPTDEGSITIDLPREFIGAEKQDGKDELFIILIDDVQVNYEESVTNSDSRIIKINFEENDAEIQVIGTYVIPEFGTITLLIFLVGIATIILVTRTKKVIERSIFP